MKKQIKQNKLKDLLNEEVNMSALTNVIDGMVAEKKGRQDQTQQNIVNKCMGSSRDVVSESTISQDILRIMESVETSDKHQIVKMLDEVLTKING